MINSRTIFMWRITCIAFAGPDTHYYLLAETVQGAIDEFRDKFALNITKIEQVCLASQVLIP